jgi:uncharacterized surface protein with fasciclin (FAS1) repeats
MKILATTAILSAIAMASPITAGECHTKKVNNIVETAVAAGSFKTLAAALEAAGLVDALSGKGSFTVFAPTDAAFAKLPKSTVEDLLKPENKSKLQAILKFHVVSGNIGLSDALAAKSAKSLQGEPINVRFSNGKVKINDASLISADIKTSNGVIHAIDSVMLPPEPKNDIASVAKKSGQFNTLLAAVGAAGLDKALSGKNSVTVFAPTDDAFKALPKGTVESLLKPENLDKLKAILTLHVVPGRVSAGNALNAKSSKSLNGDTLNFGIENGLFQVNGATIVKTDIQCDNGVIHVIDSVILPKTKINCHSASSDTSPSQMITKAITKGVPVFNHGNHSKCADIYQQCLVSLTKATNVDCSTRAMLHTVLTRSQKINCDTTRAWTLRTGLDNALASMNK